MAVNLGRIANHLPVVKEVRAVQNRAERGPNPSGTEVRTVCTALIAVAVIGLVSALLLRGQIVPAALWAAFTTVIGFYFIDPQTLAANIVSRVLASERQIDPALEMKIAQAVTQALTKETGAVAARALAVEKAGGYGNP